VSFLKGFAEHIKLALTVAFVLLLGILSAVRLMKIQIVGDDEIIKNPQSNSGAFVYTKNIKSTRGEIVDYSGNPIICNSTAYNVVIEKALFPEDNKTGNRILLETYQILLNHGYEFKDSIPISKTFPYVFLPDSDDDAAELKSSINLNVYATAENCIDKIIDDYDISDEYSDDEKRIIAGLRYELILKDFAYSNDFIFAENIDIETLIEIKEKSTV